MSEVPDTYDRLLGQLDGLPDTAKVRPSTFRVIAPLGVGGSRMWSVQTFRQQHRNEEGKVIKSEDWVFIESAGADGVVRLAIPPRATAAIARHRDSLTGLTRRRTAREQAQKRLERGETPGFLRKRGAKRKKKRGA